MKVSTNACKLSPSISQKIIATWDSPPRQNEPGYSAFKVAFGRFLDSRKVHIKLRNKKQIEDFESRRKNEFRQKYALKQDEQPDLGQQEQLKLMPFQVNNPFTNSSNFPGALNVCRLMDLIGFATTGGIISRVFSRTRWDWYTSSSSPILAADPFFQGKTVQIVTFIGNIIKEFNAAPVLVVVPHSTITNWAREFSAWAPGIRVVPFYGEAKSREVIKRYELRHPTKIQGTTGSKFHVLVTTYDTITSKDFNSVIRNIPRWEMLVVDEGQRRK